jgi:hypothetical protein
MYSENEEEEMEDIIESRNKSFCVMEEDMSGEEQDERSLIFESTNETNRQEVLPLDTMTDWMTLNILKESQMELQLDSFRERIKELERLNSEWEMKYLGLKKEMSLRQRLLVGGGTSSLVSGFNDEGMTERENAQREEEEDFYDPGQEEEDEEYAPYSSVLPTCRKKTRFSTTLVSPGSPLEKKRYSSRRPTRTGVSRKRESLEVVEVVKEKERVPCPHCDKTYVDQRRLDKHLKDKHPCSELSPLESMDIESPLRHETHVKEENDENEDLSQTPFPVPPAAGVKKR